MPVPKDIIEAIKNRHINSDKEFVLDSLSGAIDRLQKAFPRYGSFIMEFIQNADDAQSKSLLFEISSNKIKIFNDGVPFTENDVKNICRIGRSSKTAKDYIGYLGVGFKSVFLISDSPEIYSGDFKFKFSKTEWGDPKTMPWQIIPLWIDNPVIPRTGYTTTFNIPVKSEEIFASLMPEIKPDHLNNRILLFLRYIHKIEVIDLINKINRKIIKSKIIDYADYQIYHIQEFKNDDLVSNNNWLIFRNITDVPKDVKFDLTTKEWERDIVGKREVMVAFRLTDEGYLEIEEHGTAHIGVFSFLPLKEIPSGLNFLMQADYLTAPGRSELARGCLWNNWLADEVLKLILNKCVPTFLSHENWRMNFTQVLYSSQGGHELFEGHIKRPLNNYILENQVLIAEDGSIAKIDGIIIIEDPVRKLISNDDLRIIYPGKKIIHRECKPDRKLEIETAPKDIDSFLLSNQGEQLLKHKASSRDIDWFKKLYFELVSYYNFDYFFRKHYKYNVAYDDFWNKMHRFHKPIILTYNYDLAEISGSFINSKKLVIPDQIKDGVKIVHPDLVKYDEFNIFRRKLNEERHCYAPPSNKVIREITEDDIKTALIKYETNNLTEEKWQSLSEEERINRLIDLKKLWDLKYLPLDKFNFITLKCKDNDWRFAQEINLPKEYNPDQNLEILVEKGLLDKPLNLLATDFIVGKEEDEIRKWRKFFLDLGVDKNIETDPKSGGFTNRISVLTALKFENSKRRSPRELGESEKPGYDIISTSDTEERYIEVKGTSKKSYDIYLTKKLFKTLQKLKDKYYIYVIIDSLKNPILYSINGKKLLEITDIDIGIKFSEWREAIDEEYQP